MICCAIFLLLLLLFGDCCCSLDDTRAMPLFSLFLAGMRMHSTSLWRS
jgi:hypothetical protein